MDVVVATLFAVLAGAGTALSPCVLPVLPVALAAGATGGRRRPLGVAVGLAGTFALAARAAGAGARRPRAARRPRRAGSRSPCCSASASRCVVPRLGAALEGAAEPPGAARGGDAGRGDGFRSGLVLGASLGLVYAPCAGPILAAVVALDAAVVRRSGSCSASPTARAPRSRCSR